MSLERRITNPKSNRVPIVCVCYDRLTRLSKFIIPVLIWKEAVKWIRVVFRREYWYDRVQIGFDRFHSIRLEKILLSAATSENSTHISPAIMLLSGRLSRHAELYIHNAYREYLISTVLCIVTIRPYNLHVVLVHGIDDLFKGFRRKRFIRWFHRAGSLHFERRYRMCYSIGCGSHLVEKKRRQWTVV